MAPRTCSICSGVAWLCMTTSMTYLVGVHHGKGDAFTIAGFGPLRAGACLAEATSCSSFRALAHRLGTVTGGGGSIMGSFVAAGASIAFFSLSPSFSGAGVGSVWFVGAGWDAGTWLLGHSLSLTC